MSLTSPLISVIIPAYNHQLYIASTIKSIITQSYSNIELLIINDGSTDKTWDVIKSFEKKYESRFTRFVFETQENLGTCDTINKLVNLAEGKYIYLIASDDIVKPRAVEILCDFLEQHNDYALVVGNNEFIDSSGNIIDWNKKTNSNILSDCHYATFGDYLRSIRSDVDFFSPDFGSYESLLLGNYIPNGYLVRKSIFEKIEPFTNEAPLEDYYLMLQIAQHSKLKYLDEILFSYRWHGKNTANNRLKMLDLTSKTLAYFINQMNK